MTAFIHFYQVKNFFKKSLNNLNKQIIKRIYIYQVVNITLDLYYYTHTYMYIE